jgi:hypothetical protein
MVRVQGFQLVCDNRLVRAQSVGSVIEFVLLELLEGMECVEKRLFVAEIGLQMAVGVVEIGGPSCDERNQAQDPNPHNRRFGFYGAGMLSYLAFLRISPDLSAYLARLLI